MNKFMKIAYDEALLGLSLKHGGPFGALIVKDDQIIAQGHNEVLLRKDPSAHAEILVIRQACAALDTVDLSGYTLYTTAKPCPMCKGAIQWSRIKNVVFSGNYLDTEKLNFDDLNFSDSFEDETGNWQQIDQNCFKTLIEKFESYKHDIKY